MNDIYSWSNSWKSSPFRHSMHKNIRIYGIMFNSNDFARYVASSIPERFIIFQELCLLCPFGVVSKTTSHELWTQQKQMSIYLGKWGDSFKQVNASDNAGPGSDIWGMELRSEGKETLLEKKKTNGIILGCNLILSEIFISEWTLSKKYQQDILEI